jgi:superfamily II DNA or RNA helicase
MDYHELIVENMYLSDENRRLKEENRVLKSRLGIPAGPEPVESPVGESRIADTRKAWDAPAKIRLFMDYFSGRTDVYAKRWKTKSGKSGYSPVCRNEWNRSVCEKPRVKCADCIHRQFAPMDSAAVDSHLRGELTAGIYPLQEDDTCRFLAMDFDGENWLQDTGVIRSVCLDAKIPVALERSRSGDGGHVWFFFREPVPAALARKFGSALLTAAMNRRHELPFSSYDRLFPNQDTMPKGGFGNLIALPFQKEPRQSGNSLFIDSDGKPYANQWDFLASLSKIDASQLEEWTAKLSPGSELGILVRDPEELPKPWENRQIRLSRADFPETLEIVISRMLFVSESGISQRGLSRLKRLAAFANPEFYQAQAMRLPVYNKPRIVDCSESEGGYLALPRGCLDDVTSLLNEAGVTVVRTDKTFVGSPIQAEFRGELRKDQLEAAEALLIRDNGILCGTTAFGKTVVAIYLIARRKVSTLILVDRVQLQGQWKEKLERFMEFRGDPPAETSVKKGRKKRITGPIGLYGGGKDRRTGKIDIAVMQSLSRKSEFPEWVQEYGMVIVDECHHVPAFGFEKILRNVKAKTVYGLSATPARKDGHHPILFMQCGPVVYRDDPKTQAEKRPFGHSVIPRFTSLRIPFSEASSEITIQDIYREITENEARNLQIADDVFRCREEGRNCLVLSERTAHVENLAREIRKRIPSAQVLSGGQGAKKTEEMVRRVSEIPAGEPLTLIATGRFIGEGFDEPRLDTLFLAMPVSWKGTLQQYAGRLHRLYAEKSEVRIYDYIDVHLKMTERMYWKRQKGYAAMGYRLREENGLPENPEVLYDRDSFLPVFQWDIESARDEIVLYSPFMSVRRGRMMLETWRPVIRNGISVAITTRPVADYEEKLRPGLAELLEEMRRLGMRVRLEPAFHQKFAVIDRRTVWYGSVNLLSFGGAEESMMRLDSPQIAHELLKGMEE